MRISVIATEFNGSLKAAQAHIIDVDRYDIVECGAAGQPQLDLIRPLKRPQHRIYGLNTTKHCKFTSFLLKPSIVGFLKRLMHKFDDDRYDNMVE